MNLTVPSFYNFIHILWLINTFLFLCVCPTHSILTARYDIASANYIHKCICTYTHTHEWTQTHTHTHTHTIKYT